MQALMCELCGSNDVVKQDGFFVCQHCGTKYTVEEARKLLGTVRIDTTEEVKNLYQIARRARDNNNAENAQKFYDQILVKDPSSWEANFYAVYYQSMQTKIADISSAAIRMKNTEDSVLHLIQQNVTEPNARKKAVLEVAVRCISLGELLYTAARNQYVSIDLAIRPRYGNEYVERAVASVGVISTMGDLIERIFGEEYAKEISAPCWNKCITLYQSMLPHLTKQGKQIVNNQIRSFRTKIQTYNPAQLDRKAIEKQIEEAYKKDPGFRKEYQSKGGAIVFLILSIAFLSISVVTLMGLVAALYDSQKYLIPVYVTMGLCVVFAVLLVFAIIRFKKIGRHNAAVVKTYKEKYRQEAANSGTDA